ncbi:MAG: aminotransferase class IV [Solirubrobacteraceae bacterium MAG38_C4-C5]|nr:aminotransferase class IV [Candidatus Siliceabacter maunaloa]
MPDACVDGELLDANEARIPATDDGLLRGDGVFEVVRLYGGRPFALEEHLERMELSAANLRLPLDVGAVRADVAALLGAADASDTNADGSAVAGTGTNADGSAVAGTGDACLRLVATRGGRRLAFVEPLPASPMTLRLASVTYAPTRLMDGVKSLSYAPNMLATRLAAERGADDALLVTPHGRVLEAPRQAFFYVLEGALLTPPLSDHVLDSITRRRVIAAAGARERSVALEDLRHAEEAFLASTLREVHPVGAVDDVVFVAAPGPVTAEAAAVVRERIAAELDAGHQC